MTYAERVKLAKALGLVLATRIGDRPVYLVDDKTQQRLDFPGWKMHYPPEPSRLVPKN